MKSKALLVVTGMLGMLDVGNLFELAFVISSLYEHGMPNLPFLLPCMATLESAPHGLRLSLEDIVSVVQNIFFVDRNAKNVQCKSVQCNDPFKLNGPHHWSLAHHFQCCKT